MLGLQNEELVDLMLDSDWVGIDAPFGWPADFIEAVTTWSKSGAWPEVDRDKLRFRATDRAVRRKARLPLSVSSDRIAMTAMRCAALLTTYAERRFGAGAQVERSGDDHVVEVYPAAALVLWSDEAAGLRLNPQGYKGTSPEAGPRRRVLVEALELGAAWLDLAGDSRELCIGSDHAIDALLCSMVARAAEKGITARPGTKDETMLASVEGWIHLPTSPSLDSLR